MAKIERKRLSSPVSVKLATKPKVVASSPGLAIPAGPVDDGFLGRADPTLIQALLAEAQDELDFREGRTDKRFDPPEPRALLHSEWSSRNYTNVYRWRHRKLAELTADPSLIEKLYGEQAENGCIKFICHWLDIYEPRNAGKNLPTRLPFLLFKRQEELLQFYHACVVEEGNGLVEKSRDMGATWCGVGYSIWMWRFVPGSAVGWGSATADKLDRIGDPQSIFEKIRMGIRGLPAIFKPKRFKDDNLMFKRIINSETGATIIGDIGDNIGRGGRTRLYFVDEAAYLEHPDAVEGALSENTRVRIDISSVSAPGTVFHRTRQAGVEWSPGKPILKDRHNVFLMDFRDHPEKNEEWAAQKKKSFESRGLGHVYAREIERDYSGTNQNAVIMAEWFDASLDLHKHLGREFEFENSGGYVAGVDIGDEGGDANAITIAKGSLIKKIKEWESRDTGVTARESVLMCQPLCPIEMQYDCVGLGAGYKAEINNLRDAHKVPSGMVFVPWHPGGAVLRPHEHMIPNDPSSPTNLLYFGNLKAQAWWHIRMLFYNAWRAKHFGENFPVDQLISLDITSICELVKVEKIHKLRDELCQVVIKPPTGKMKTIIDKKPEGVRSPNMADATVMCKFPLPSTGLLFGAGFFGAPIVVHA